jgi:hypothetical protein
MLGRHDPGTGERGDQAGARCGVEKLEQCAGVVPVGMGQPDPSHVVGIEDRGEVVEEPAIRQPQTSVDDHRLGSVQHEGVDR